jgi:hypothetical protein
MKAFPSAEPVYSKDIVGVKESTGMDLRDYFAAKAMQAIITRCDERSSEIAHVDSWVGDYAYVVADAMMEARK